MVHPKGITYEILVIDDDPLAIQLVSDVLEGENFSIRGATDAESGLELAARYRPPIVMLDLMMPNVTGMELLERILSIDPGVDVILFTGHYSTESAVEAIQKGAYDYLTKPLPPAKLREKLGKWLEDAKVRQQARKLDDELLHAFQFEGIVGRSPMMLEMFSKIRRIAPHFQTALVTGETGTGKELVAKVFHRLGPRPNGPFIVCNCAAIAESLFESELFGHVRGSFTGAASDKQGLVEAASGGTLFLDEITEIPLNVQAKLLRLLQNREIQRVGASSSKRIDLRIVAATNRDLRSLVAENKLREDLFYRLAMVDVKIPRLADRKEDLALLQRHFLDVFSERYGKPDLNLTRRAQAMMASYSWPGNVRELENTLAYCCMMAETETIDLADLPEQIRAQVPYSGSGEHELLSMEAMELKHALRVLDSVGGNRVRAAEILGISRATLYRMLGATPAKRPSARAASKGGEGGRLMMH
jgi:DNA-binding NtrC family response regulator